MTAATRARVAERTPWLIAAYFVAQFVLRLAGGDALETDEAQFVGATHFAVDYGNSHPPVYNWLVALALAATGGHWVAALALIKNVLLAGTMLLAFDAGRRVSGSATVGLLIVCGFALAPQIVWKAQTTLAHTTLALFGMVGVCHALCLVAAGGRGWRVALWLGAAAAIAILGKYSAALGLAGLAVGVAAVPAVRAHVSLRLLLGAGGAMLALAGPFIAYAALNVDTATARLAKLARDRSPFAALDLPLVGIDGALSTLLAAAAWAALPVAVWWWAGRRGSGPAAGGMMASAARVFGVASAVSVLLLVALALALDIHVVAERYLTPLLAPLPFWLAFGWPARVRTVVGTAMASALAMLVAWPLWSQFGAEQTAFPYRALAEQLAAAEPGAFAVVGEEKVAANFRLALEGLGRFDASVMPRRVVAVASGKARRPPAPPPGYVATGGAPRQLAARYTNRSGRAATVMAQSHAWPPQAR